MPAALIKRMEEVIASIEQQITLLEAQDYAADDLIEACEAKLRAAKEHLEKMTSANRQ